MILNKSHRLSVPAYRELYEGLTQENSVFREQLSECCNEDLADNLLTELELAQNRFNYAMLGVYPIYRREVELSGIVDYVNQTLCLYSFEEETVIPFSELDASYVAFLEDQKQIYHAKDLLPLSSIALKTSIQWLEEDGVDVPDISNVSMHLPSDSFCFSRKVLETAFARNMVMMNQLQEQIEKCGLDKAYHTNREDLIQYCQSNSFDFKFDRSVKELSQVAKEAENADALFNQC